MEHMPTRQSIKDRGRLADIWGHPNLPIMRARRDYQEWVQYTTQGEISILAQKA